MRSVWSLKIANPYARLGPPLLIRSITQKFEWTLKTGLVPALVLLTILPFALASEPTTNERRVCLIIAARGLDDVAQEWAQYRRSTGWEVELTEAVDAAGLLPPHWNEPKMMRDGLQQYLRDRYRRLTREGVKGGRIAVLLLGDVTMPDGSLGISTWYHPKMDSSLMGAHEPNDIATDHDYQLMDDTDELPDILLGRIPAQTQADARILLEKIQRYETNTPAGPWKKRVTYLAGEGHFGAMDRVLESLFISLVEQIVPYDYDITMTYANPTSPYCAAPSNYDRVVLDRLGEGSLFVNYLGHGSARRLDTLRWNGEKIAVCDAGRLENLPDPAGRYPVMLIVACSTGRFDLPEGKRSLSEALLFHPNGPIGVISGSRITHPYANAVFQKDVTEQLCQKKRETLGAVDLAATRALAKPDPQDQQIEILAGSLAKQMDWDSTPAELRMMHMSLYNLLGDPALQIAHPEASVLNLRYANGQISGRTKPVIGSNVTLTIETARSVIPRQGDLHPVSGRDDLDLETKAAHNYKIANDKIVFRATGPVSKRDGSFTVDLPDAVLREALDRFRFVWIKVHVSGEGGDATGAIKLDHSSITPPDGDAPGG